MKHFDEFRLSDHREIIQLIARLSIFMLFFQFACQAQTISPITDEDATIAEEYLRIYNYNNEFERIKAQPDGSKTITRGPTIATAIAYEDPAFTKPTDGMTYGMYCVHDAIVVAEAVASTSSLTPKKATILTRTAFVVKDLVKPGDLAINSHITVIREGGTVLDGTEKLTVAFSDYTPYTVGSKYLLFLSKKKQGRIGPDLFANENTILIKNDRLIIDQGKLGGLTTGESLTDALSEFHRVSSLVACYQG